MKIHTFQLLLAIGLTATISALFFGQKMARTEKSPFQPPKLSINQMRKSLLTTNSESPAQILELKRVQCLSMIESGDNDMAKGHNGEISRYQINKSVWRQYTTLPYYASTNCFTTRNIAMEIQEQRCAVFIRMHGWQPDNIDWYFLWSRPAWMTLPSRMIRLQPGFFKVLERAKRFDNLVNRKEQS